ncbi:MAG: type II toxin-antitoxin system CcdA family antitoxin [Panacagrimonas sp.]
MPAKPAPQATPKRRGKASRRINLSLSAQTIDEAKQLGMNISSVADELLAKAIKAEKTRRWKAENQAALASFDQRVERDGPLNQELLNF